MAKEEIFTVPPYQIVKATALIELTTSSKETKNTATDPQGGVTTTTTTNVRPDLYINPEDERELFIIRNPDDLNNTSSYNMVTQAASLTVTYENNEGKGKTYCPKYEVAFYMTLPATYKFISTFMPLVFVALLAILNVMNGEGEGPDVENSIALCLTVVFILPQLSPPGRGDLTKGVMSYLFSNNTSIFLLIVGLGCTSMAHPRFFDTYRALNSTGADAYIAFFDTDGNGAYGYGELFGLIGIISLATSLLIPLVNYFRYLSVLHRIQNSGFVTGKEGESRAAFCKDDSFEHWEIKTAPTTDGAKPSLSPESITHLSKMRTVPGVPETLDADSIWRKVPGDKIILLTCGPSHEKAAQAEKQLSNEAMNLNEANSSNEAMKQ